MRTPLCCPCTEVQDANMLCGNLASKITTRAFTKTTLRYDSLQEKKIHPILILDISSAKANGNERMKMSAVGFAPPPCKLSAMHCHACQALHELATWVWQGYRETHCVGADVNANSMGRRVRGRSHHSRHSEMSIELQRWCDSGMATS